MTTQTDDLFEQPEQEVEVFQPKTFGPVDAPIVVVCEPQSQLGTNLPCSKASISLFLNEAMRKGFKQDDFFFVQLCEIIPDQIKASKAKTWKYVLPFAEGVKALLKDNTRPVVTLGDLATRAVVGRACAITKVRGTLLDGRVYPMLSPAFCRTVLEQRPIFNADMQTLHTLHKNDFDLASLANGEQNYYWCTDIQHILDLSPKLISIDTETTGLRQLDPSFRVLTLQVCYNDKDVAVIPLHKKFWETYDKKQATKLREQVRTLLADKSIRKVGHNINYDISSLEAENMPVEGVLGDTQLMAWFVDENMITKTLDDLARRWVPDMAGYNDCVLPGTKLLRADNTQILAEDVVEGDVLLGFDEEIVKPLHRRRLVESVVESVKIKSRPVYKFTTSSGKVLSISEGHLMLAKNSYPTGSNSWNWVTAKELKVGARVKSFPFEEFDNSYEGGWLAGILDGEGHVRQIQGVVRVGFCQNKGLILDRALKYLKDNGYKYSISYPTRHNGKLANVELNSNESIRLLQRVRPVRLLEKFKWGFNSLPDDRIETVSSKEFIGTKNVVSIQTSSKTFIAEGLYSHNCLNLEIDKSDMMNCPKDKMLIYAGGDALATYKVFWVLWKSIQTNPGMFKLFNKLKMPGLKAFHKMSANGIGVDREYLQELKVNLAIELEELKAKLLDQVPKAVLRKQIETKKEAKFSRSAFIVDILFSEIGFNLTPTVFTKSTKGNNIDERLPSTSAKDHLPYFADREDAAGDFVRDYVEYTKLQKLYTTYICNFEESYVHLDNKIHPQFNLHIAVTGRTSSRGPNAQNFPARGKYSSMYKKLFVCTPGYKFISADLSQIELRLIAWESQDPRMLAAYRNGEDIHTITAMAVSGNTPETWALLSKDEKKLLRFRAKAVNFGLCYGMFWRKFQRFAKTDYGVDLTEQEAKAYFDTYHSLYIGIKPWHKRRTLEAKQNGFVTSLHGAKRSVPSIFHEDQYIQSQAARQAINSPIQGFGSDLGVLAIARLAAQCDPDIMRPVAFIHDDIILEVKDNHEEEGINTLLWVLNNPPLEQVFGVKAPIPILAEPDIGLNLGSMIELYDLKPEERPYWLPEFNINPKKPEWWKDELEVW